MTNYDVVVFGTVNPDIVVYPPEGIKLAYSRLSFSLKRAIRPAGPGGYAAITFARLGLRTCSIDAVSKGVFGQYIKEELERFGVDTKHMIPYSGEEMFTISIVDEKGEGGTMIAAPPSEPIFNSFQEMMLFFNNMPKATIFYLGHWFWPYLNLVREKNIPKYEILHTIKQNGFSIALDINYKAKEDPDQNEVVMLKKALEYVDVLLPNVRDAKIIAKLNSIEDIATSLLELGPKIVGIKLGERGSYIASKRGNVYVPSFNVKVEDTTGAGDVFGAAFTFGWLKGWNIDKIGKFANAVAAIFISNSKLDKKFPTFNQVNEFLKLNNYKNFNLN
jgi:sugar/nucleoside kinase (ribokinase family)